MSEPPKHDEFRIPPDWHETLEELNEEFDKRIRAMLNDPDLERKGREAVQRWLVEPVTFDEARDMLTVEIDGVLVSEASGLDEWLSKEFQPGDELWYYDNGEEAWKHLGGRCGFAIVRGGAVVDTYLWRMN